MISSLQQAVIGFGLTQVGVEEDPRGSNSGPLVSGYLRYVNLSDGAAWCAAFVSFCVNQGSFGIGVPAEFKKSGGALHLLEINPHLRIDAPEDMCIAVMDHGHGKGHVFFVTKVEGDKLYTLEGNTDPNGGREGYGVFERVRSVSDINGGFLRIQ